MLVAIQSRAGRQLFAPRVLSREDTAAEGIIGDNAQLLIGAQWQYLQLGTAIERIVDRLQADKAAIKFRIRQIEILSQLPAAQIGGGHIADLALAHQIIQRFQRLLGGTTGIPTVDLVDIDDIGSKSA